MAAPSHITLQSLSGTYKLNKRLSDDFAQVLALQGVSALVRTAASAASIHLSITQPDQQHIRMAQSVTAGHIPGTTEEYVLDWNWREGQDGFFGRVEGRSRWIGVGEVGGTGVLAGGEGLKEGPWLRGDSEGRVIQAEGRKEGEWEARHLWGFEEVGGERRHTRRVYVRNAQGEEWRGVMVYDWVGE
ncbi:uncharacterized protein HMPREF1541_05346 [Cyphellophora europaea CBS 101466]|uniref:Uncharacterized protein n=1 Tax=Cyphellophora europaea (strain CBS 101466) TaxID=1220924 RepID=W2RTP5_CYPE1|nr:uncharacterized protein HMPREF1541_05346 [Cyphellophora europaea CBS 101466]ETN39123.1 hypothetical protein HMPREF1541_05346 [Cyphellophora europaea CBS 101466]